MGDDTNRPDLTATVAVTDPDLCDEIGSLEPEAADALTQHIFDLGVAVRRSTQADTNSLRIGERLEQFEQHINDVTRQAQDSLVTQIERILDPETGTLAKSATAGSDKLSATISEALNTDDRRSAASKLVEALTAQSSDTVSTALKELRTLFDVSRDDGPLASLRRELVNELATPIHRVSEQVTTMHSVVVERNRRPTTGTDGLEFEDTVGAVLTDAATVCGDSVTPVGADTGIGTSKIGDFVVDVTSPSGRVGRFAVEAKDRELGPKAMRTQLDGAIANRDATAAILIVSSPEAGWQRQPLHRISAGQYVAVLDRDDPDNSIAVRLAYQMARLDVLNELADADSETSLDVAALRSRIDQARRLLDSVSSIKGTLTTASRSIERSKTDIDDLRSGLVELLDEIESDIRNETERDEQAA